MLRCFIITFSLVTVLEYNLCTVKLIRISDIAIITVRGGVLTLEDHTSTCESAGQRGFRLRSQAFIRPRNGAAARTRERNVQ